jgi:hypothetical protein
MRGNQLLWQNKRETGGFMVSSSASSIAPFKTADELVGHAEGLLRGRCDSLVKDVAHCLSKPYAPYPAILYCFSTIDLLGALAAGRGDNHRPATQHSRNYIKLFMKYADPIPTLLMGQFRHKLVHLAGPKTVFEYEDNASQKHKVVWNYTHNTAGRHLQLDGVVGLANIDNGLWTLPYDQSFWLDITSFANDIVNSVFGPNGYLAQLKTDATMQVRYAAALNDLYDPTK